MTTGIDMGACASCGSALAVGSAFCESCGARVAARPRQAGPATSAFAPPHQRATSMPPPGMSAAGMPVDIHLTAGERILFRTQFTPHLILSHLKVSVVATNKRLVVQEPNTLFGVISQGYLEKASPLSTITQITAGNAMSGRKLVGGAVSVLAALYFFLGLPGYGIIVGLALLALAAFLFLSARTVGIFFHNFGGGVLAAPAGHREEPAVEHAKRRINDLLFADAPTPQESPAGQRRSSPS